MAAPASRFLAPAALAALDDLELIAKTVVEGYLTGRHLLPQAGFGVEFAQYRSYDPGDDLRRVDWKVYARSDRFFVRQAEVERDVTVRFVLDATGSMAHAEDGLTKLDYACLATAGLAYLAHRQGDRIALHVIRDGTCDDLPPGGKRPLHRLLHHLDDVTTGGGWPTFDELQPHLVTSRAREIVVLVSDLYDDGERIEAMVENLRALGHELLVLQIMGRHELELDWTGDVEFEDLETGRTVAGNVEALRSRYREQLDAELERWRNRLLDLRVAHAVLTLDTPFEIALREFLIRRSELPP